MEGKNPLRAISNKEVQLLTSRKARQCRRLLRKIRQKLGKTADQVITVADFCCYMGFDIEKVWPIILAPEKQRA
jgi:hypothetical protein